MGGSFFEDQKRYWGRLKDFKNWKKEVRDPAVPLRPVMIEWQVEHHFWIVALRLIVRMASWMVGDMRKEGLLAGKVIIVGRRLDWGIMHSVALRVVNRLCTSSRTW